MRGGKDAWTSRAVTGAEASNAEKAFKPRRAGAQEKNYLEAVRYFEYVRNNFPYSQFASLAELAIADMSFDAMTGPPPPPSTWTSQGHPSRRRRAN